MKILRKFVREMKRILFLMICIFAFVLCFSGVSYYTKAPVPILISLVLFVTLFLIPRKIPKKSETYINENGYVVIRKIKELEHRYIAQQVLHRELMPNEVVHHINGNKVDNNINNLCLMDKNKHEHFHAWLAWKKSKQGFYPGIDDQKKVLQNEYGGILIEEARASLRVNLSANSVANSGKLPSIDLDVGLTLALTSDEQEELFHKLKKERNRISFNQKIPAYMVFDNKSLRYMAKHLPKSRSDLLAIPGVGVYRYEIYGEHFLEFIEAELHGIKKSKICS